MWANEAYRNALQLQRFLMERAKTGEEKALVLAGIARAFCELEETKRKLRMKPLPKSIDVSINGKPKQKRSSNARDVSGSEE